MSFLKRPTIFWLLAVIAVVISIYFRFFTKYSDSSSIKPTETIVERLNKEHCAHLSSSGYASKCAETIHAANVRKYSELVRQEDGKLYLKLLQGSPVFKEDIYLKEDVQNKPESEQRKLSTTEDPNAIIQYTLYHYYEKPNLFLIGILYFEGGGYFLIDRNNGNEYEVVSEPLFSPDGKKFVTASSDLESGYDPNAVEVWEHKKNQWSRVFHKDFETHGYDSPHWVSDDKIVFKKYGWVQNKVKAIAEGHLGFSNGQWQIIEK